MDTILYFYKKRGLEKPEIEPVGLKTYLLIRIGLDVGEGQWFGKIPEPRPRVEAAEGPAGSRKRADIPGISADAAETGGRSGGRGGEQGGKGAGSAPEAGHARAETRGRGPAGDRHGPWEALRHPWKAVRRNRTERKRRRRERAGRRAWEQEEARWLAARERLWGEIGSMMGRLALEVEELAGDMAGCRCVYEDSLRKALVEEQRVEGDARMREILPILWRRNLPVEEFHGYTGQFWVEQVFARAARLPELPPQFVILGTAPGLPEVIEAHVRRMKSLRWVLRSAEWDEELSVFVEDFYTEYGLAIELQLVEDMAALKRLRLSCKESVSIVDFTGEACMAVPAAPEGSVWLDMLSVEEKRHRITARGKGIIYFSMKEIWKSAQKRCNCPPLP